MSGYGEAPEECELIQDELAEFALGTLFGRRRSEVLQHIGSCPMCSATLNHLSTVADAMLQLAPRKDPPLGFELRLAERLQAMAPATSSVHRPRGFGRVSMLAAASVLIVVLGFSVGALATRQGGNRQAQSSSVVLASAHLTSQGHVVGLVMITAGRPAWMFMTVTTEGWTGGVTCQVTLAGGRVETVGVYRLSGGYGAWGAPLPSPAGGVRSARLLAPNGTVLASARLSA